MRRRPSLPIERAPYGRRRTGCERYGPAGSMAVWSHQIRPAAALLSDAAVVSHPWGVAAPRYHGAVSRHGVSSGRGATPPTVLLYLDGRGVVMESVLSGIARYPRHHVVCGVSAGGGGTVGMWSGGPLMVP